MLAQWPLAVHQPRQHVAAAIFYMESRGKTINKFITVKSGHFDSIRRDGLCGQERGLQ